MTEYVVPARLIAMKEDTYTLYVFKNTESNNYIMCTRLPNWQTPNMFIGDSGFLQFQIIKAGDEYFNINTEQKEKYLYSNVYFKNFINKSDIENSEIIL